MFKSREEASQEKQESNRWAREGEEWGQTGSPHGAGDVPKLGTWLWEVHSLFDFTVCYSVHL